MAGPGLPPLPGIVVILRKLTDRVWILNAPLIDGYGGARVRDWAAAEQAIDPDNPTRALVQFLGSSEDLDARDATSTQWRLIVGPDEVLDEFSRVRWGGIGHELEVEGEPGLIMKNGVVDHIEATLVATLDADPTDG